VSQDSPDVETKVGAVLVHGTTGAILGSGLNGFIRGGPDFDLPKTRPDKHLYIIHAESNLLANCARHGISTDGCFIFCTLSPCINCARLLFQAGIGRVVFKDKYRDFDKNRDMLDLEFNLTEEHGYFILDLKPKGAL
jgi:dCMP deaminase